MTQDLKTTADVIKAGEYDWQRVGSMILTVCSIIEGAAALGASLPPSVAPLLEASRGWAALIGLVVGTALAKLGKPVLVRADGDA